MLDKKAYAQANQNCAYDENCEGRSTPKWNDPSATSIVRALFGLNPPEVRKSVTHFPTPINSSCVTPACRKIPASVPVFNLGITPHTPSC
jgi:hypothetical protein